MFKRDHHVRIATVLQALDAQYLAARGCFFGGGTAIVLSRDEYRESIDIDFMVSSKDGYRDLRQALSGAKTLASILKKESQLKLATGVRVDQYGIRTMLNIGGVEIKFEIVSEGRIEFESPAADDQICGVSTLTTLDMAASKLLANSDRWSDASVFSRDLIDLAMLEPESKTLNAAIKKASEAYGDSVETDLKKSIEYFKEYPSRLDDCMEALKMDSMPKAVLWEKIRKLC